MNKLIISEFEKLIYDTQVRNDSKNIKFKIISYRKVISIIKKLDFEIESSEQIKDYKGIGKSTIEKISTIIDKGKLNNLKNKSNKNINHFSDLQRITGIGPKKARDLIKMNITLETLLDIDLNNLTDTNINILNNLTHHQILGIKYFYDIEKRIPYNEISDIEIYLKQIVKKIDPELDIIICGSYRRKCKDSGDIDILLFNKLHNSKKELETTKFLMDFLCLLKKNKFIVDDLTTVESKTKYMGFCKMYKINRRIDIRMVGMESLYSAILYFTGSGDFNKKMRTHALSKNFTLNEYGLYSIDDNKIKIKKCGIKSEKHIFDLLGLEYLEPENRLSDTQIIKN